LAFLRSSSLASGPGPKPAGGSGPPARHVRDYEPPPRPARVRIHALSKSRGGSQTAATSALPPFGGAAETPLALKIGRLGSEPCASFAPTPPMIPETLRTVKAGSPIGALGQKVRGVEALVMVKLGHARIICLPGRPESMKRREALWSAAACCRFLLGQLAGRAADVVAVRARTGSLGKGGSKSFILDCRPVYPGARSETIYPASLRRGWGWCRTGQPPLAPP
jgi:hypothetical protein